MRRGPQPVARSPLPEPLSGPPLNRHGPGGGSLCTRGQLASLGPRSWRWPSVAMDAGGAPLGHGPGHGRRHRLPSAPWSPGARRPTAGPRSMCLLRAGSCCLDHRLLAETDPRDLLVMAMLGPAGLGTCWPTHLRHAVLERTVTTPTTAVLDHARRRSPVTTTRTLSARELSGRREHCGVPPHGASG